MTTIPTSAIPAALTGLVSLLRADPALSDVTVLDGPPVSPIASGATLLIGANGDESDVLSASSTLDDASLGRGDTAESLEIRCHVEYWEGTEHVEPCRSKAFAVLDAVKAAVSRDPRLGGAVRRARLTGQLSYAAARFEGETGVGVPFTIRCDVL